MMPRIRWPEGKSFAFSVFDDPDGQTLAVGRAVYDFLGESGFRTTKGVWPIWGNQPRNDDGGSCDDEDYRAWCLELHEAGFEIGFHNATQYTSDRVQTLRGLDRFAALFGHDPITMSNHYNSHEAIYWGDYRVSGIRRVLYSVLTRGQNRNRFFGHVPHHPYYWGDLCRERVTYVRNFVFTRINTIAACPYMPYNDPARPLVNGWYASSEGAKAESFMRMIAEANQDCLEAEGGACIMYTHFGHGYVRNGRLDPRFRALMTRLSRMNGWFVPVGTLLNYLRSQRGLHVLTTRERAELERRWLWDKIRNGTA
jgi:hypothetical protein